MSSICNAQKMASLPEEQKPPFTDVGISCFGLFTVRHRQTTAKRNGVLFTCLAICVVYIEVVYSLDTESFINTLWQSIARKGCPEQIRSDHKGNIMKSEKELHKTLQVWNQAQIHKCLLQHDIKWMFNPSAASHHGGVWERFKQGESRKRQSRNKFLMMKV